MADENPAQTQMARTKNTLKEGSSDDAAASGGSAEKTASLRTHSPAGAKGSKRTRSPQNQEEEAGRNVVAKRSSARSREAQQRTEHGEEAAQTAKAEAAETHLKTKVAQLPARARKYQLLVYMTKKISALTVMPTGTNAALTEGKLCSTLHFSLPAPHAPGQVVLGDSFDNSPPPKTEADVIALIRDVLPRTICENKGNLHNLPSGLVLQKSGASGAVDTGHGARLPRRTREFACVRFVHRR